MKLYTKIFFIVISVFTLYAQDCKSKLVINSDSVIVNVLVDDSLFSTSNHPIIELPNGKYFIKIIEANHIWNSKYFIDTLELKECETKVINFNPDRRVYLDSNPQDAYVFYGDSLIGSTPNYFNKFSRKLLLKKNGYADYDYLNNNSANQVKINLKFINNQKKESFFSSTAFKVLAGTAIALGTVTAYFKLKADNRFDEYKASRDQ